MVVYEPGAENVQKGPRTASGIEDVVAYSQVTTFRRGKNFDRVLLDHAEALEAAGLRE